MSEEKQKDEDCLGEVLYSSREWVYFISGGISARKPVDTEPTPPEPTPPEPTPPEPTPPEPTPVDPTAKIHGAGPVIDAKVIIIGNIGIGKTCLARRFIDNTFNNNRGNKDTGLIGKKVVNVDGTDVRLSVYAAKLRDTTDEYPFGFFDKVDVCILCYDMTDPNSFENVKSMSWTEEFKHYATRGYATDYIVVGTKSDLQGRRQVPMGLVSYFCKQLQFKWFEVSCKDGTNVEDVFHHAATLKVSPPTRRRLNLT
jgi:small GTP-binding protein